MLKSTIILVFILCLLIISSHDITTVYYDILFLFDLKYDKTTNNRAKSSSNYIIRIRVEFDIRFGENIGRTT